MSGGARAATLETSAAAMAALVEEGSSGRRDGDSVRAAEKQPATTTAAAAAEAPTTPSFETATSSTANTVAALASAAAAEREESERLAALEAEAEIRRGYHSWLSWWIDLSCVVIFSFTYILAAILIFVISSRRAPGICNLGGVEGADCEAILQQEIDVGRV